MSILKIPKEKSIRYMSSKNEPVLSCRSGDTILFETEDCFGGQIECEADAKKLLDDNRMNH